MSKFRNVTHRVPAKHCRHYQRFIYPPTDALVRCLKKKTLKFTLKLHYIKCKKKCRHCSPSNTILLLLFSAFCTKCFDFVCPSWTSLTNFLISQNDNYWCCVVSLHIRIFCLMELVKQWSNLYTLQASHNSTKCNLLTYSMVQSPSWEANWFAASQKFPAFHGTRRFITALTSVRHLSLSWASPIQSIYPHPTSRRSKLILSTHLRLGLPSGQKTKNANEYSSIIEENPD